MVFTSSDVPLIASSTGSGRGIGAASSSPPKLVPGSGHRRKGLDGLPPSLKSIA